MQVLEAIMQVQGNNIVFPRNNASSKNAILLLKLISVRQENLLEKFQANCTMMTIAFVCHKLLFLSVLEEEVRRKASGIKG